MTANINTHRTAGTPGGRRAPGIFGAHTRYFVGPRPDMPVIIFSHPNDPAADPSGTAIKIWETTRQLVATSEGTTITACSPDALSVLTKKAEQRSISACSPDTLSVLTKKAEQRLATFEGTAISACSPDALSVLFKKAEQRSISACSPDALSVLTEKTEQRFATPEGAAMIFLQGANKLKNGDVTSALHNTYLQGGESYPTDVVGAYNLLCRWRKADATNANTSENVASTNFLQSHVERIVEEVNNLDYDGIF